ncbi:MAG: ATP-binding protein [Alphaproteobacteria bacterium]|jgi:predicted AAA+ superfamily ATPase|tara:strand:+ start:250 stop:1113 length:864 start_codon:yes stop_codon:yes gene_type:complete
MNINDKILSLIQRSTKALEKISKVNNENKIDISNENGYLWSAENFQLTPVKKINSINIDLLKGIDQTKSILLQNTKQFSQGFPANNVLLWGARGMGKSSLVKSIHREVSLEKNKNRLILIEIYRDDIKTLPLLISQLNNYEHRFIIYCDDLSFNDNENNYKSLKTVLDGGIMERSQNIIFYATSNRRHLMARSMIENENSTAISPSESAEEKISLSDRFGLWLGFYQCSQDEYLNIVISYASYFKLKIKDKELKDLAIEWSVTRGSRSGRVAWQFIHDLAGKLKIKL